MCRRDINNYYRPNTLLVNRGNLMEDRELILNQQLLQIQQMMMDIGVTNMTGTSPETIQSLPTKKVESLAEDPEASKCMVCLSSYEIGDDTTILFCCKLYLVHAFHSICIRE